MKERGIAATHITSTFCTDMLASFSVFFHLYRLVVDTISPLDGDRKCFRLVGGVLVERTVKEVLPALKTNQEGVNWN